MILYIPPLDRTLISQLLLKLHNPERVYLFRVIKIEKQEVNLDHGHIHRIMPIVLIATVHFALLIVLLMYVRHLARYQRPHRPIIVLKTYLLVHVLGHRRHLFVLQV